MEYIKMDKLSFDPRAQMGKIFAEGFYEQGLKFLCKDKEKLARAFEHIFILEKFYAAVAGEEIMALVGCTEKKPPPYKLDKKIFIREIGFLRGRFAHWGFNMSSINHKYPFDMPINTGSVELVATAEKHRGKGAAFGLLDYVMRTEPFEDYVLETVDTNAPAIGLYEKLGFKEFMRKPAPTKKAGFSHFVYMKREMYH